MKQVVQIALIEPQIGYLDVKSSTEFPLTLSAQEIKDITQKKGTFSKSIELDGTKNNNILLNNYWDVNIQAGTFNINRVQKCQVLLNGVTILEEGVLQLVSIKKLSNTIAQNNLVEYTVLIKDTKADLFTAIGGRELTDIDFSYLNHTLTSSHVISTFNNTVEDEYKYYLPYSESNSYMVQDLRLGIFEKVYLDKIIGGAGFTWSWPGYSAMTAQADKTIVPFAGGKIAANSDDYVVQAALTATTSYNYDVPYSNSSQRLLFQLPIEVKDDNDLYIPSSSTYVNNFYLSNGQALTYNLSFTYEYYIVNPHSVSIKLNGTGSFPSAKKYNGVIAAHKNGNYNSSISTPIFFPNQFGGYQVPLNTVYSASTENFIGSATTTGTLSMTNIVPGDLITLSMLATEANSSGTGSEWKRNVAPLTAVTPDIRVKIKSATLYATTTIDQLTYNAEVDVNLQVPKKVKQSDFLKQFLTRYNLIVEINPDNPTQLIFTPRDEYYDAGTVKDWTKKLAKEKEQTITPVSNSYKKKLILTYKQDDTDPVLKGYKENVNEIYGQVEYTFDSDFIKDVETKELIVSPVAVGKNINGNVLPYLSQSTENNVKLALNAKQMTAATPIIIYNYTGSSSSSSSTSIYPLIHHWDNDRNPSFDINFGTNDFYFYNDVGSLTNNNLYNIYWRRTASQIDKGWILTAYFDLNEMDVKTLNFNDKIQIGNTYYNINQVVDYKANKNELTKVELITADDALELPRFKTRIPSLPALPSDIAVGPIRNIIDKEIINSNIFINSNPVIAQGTGNIFGQYVGGGIVRGNGNLVAGDSVIFGDKNTVNSTKSFVIGDSNTSSGQKSVIIGDGNTIQEGIENAFVFGNNITATTDNSLYANNLQVDTINGISASTFTAATSGDFCGTGISTDSISACTGDSQIDLNNGIKLIVNSGEVFTSDDANITTSSGLYAPVMISTRLGQIEAGSVHSTIIGGMSNYIKADDGILGSNIFGGNSNSIFNSDSFIIGGYSNIVGTNTAGIIISSNSIISGTSTNSSIIGGSINNINNATNSVVIGGISNNVYSNRDGIFAGSFNSISGGSGVDSAIAGATNSNILNANASFIGGGYVNNINNAANASIIGGTYNTINSASEAFIGGGSYNTASGSKSSVIGGINNTASGGNSSIIGGQGNTASNNHSIVIGAGNSTASGNYSFVFGGSSVTASGNNSVAIGGYGSIISGNYSTAVAGFYSQVSGTYSGILAGNSNINRGDNSAVIAGRAGVINPSSNYSALIGGANNSVAASRTVVIGGQGISGNVADSVYVPKLNVGILTGTSVANLGVDANGFVVTATTIAGTTTQVQPGSNILTGGTSLLPIVSLVASPSVNNLTFSGTALGGTVQAGSITATSLSAGTLSGGTILSGGTNLYSIFSPLGSTFTGGTVAGATTFNSNVTMNEDLTVDDIYQTSHYQTQTTNATETTIASATLSSEYIYMIEANVCAGLNTTNSGITCKIIGSFKNNGGVVTQIGELNKIVNSDFSTADVKLDISGTTVRVRITGQAGNTIDWGCSLIIHRMAMGVI
jgi:hypothetical protein